MASFDFPSNPNVGDTFNDPVTGATFRWNGYGWDGGAGGGTGAIIVAPSPPPTPPDSALWWESDTGYMYIRYNDGNSAQWVQVNAVPNLANYVAKTGDSMTGNLSIGSSGSAALNLNKAAGANANILAGFQASLQRWDIQLGTASAESTGNAGSDFSVDRFSDAGAYIDSPLVINRATGNTAFSSTLTIAPVSGASLVVAPSAAISATISLSKPNAAATQNVIAGSTNGLNRWLILPGSAGAESGGNVGGDFAIQRCADAGTTIDTPFSIKRSTGATTFGAGVVGTTAQFTTNYNGLTYFGYPTASDFYMQLSGNIRVLAWRGGVYNMSLDNSTGTVSWIGNSAVVMSLDYTGNLTVFSNLTVNGNGFKPGGGSWAATSDARIKNVQSEYKQGLEDVLALNPVVYSYKGNDTDKADGTSTHAKVAEAKTPYVGLIAQEVEKIFPGMVTKRDGFIDGEPVDDLRELDTTPLIYALINAVKELSARIATLEATP